LKAVIFDFGGVLVRTEDRTPRRELAKGLGMSYAEIDQLVFSSLSGKQAALGLISALQHWEEIGQNLRLTPTELKDFRSRFFAGDRLDWELIEAIRKWRGRYQIALLSNAWDDLRNYLQGTWHIMDHFCGGGLYQARSSHLPTGSGTPGNFSGPSPFRGRFHRKCRGCAAGRPAGGPF
jgi:FMN phosphatase YigB (HAD superfamily)